MELSKMAAAEFIWVLPLLWPHLHNWSLEWSSVCDIIRAGVSKLNNTGLFISIGGCACPRHHFQFSLAVQEENQYSGQSYPVFAH